MDKIDTQGMSGPVDPNYKGPIRVQPHKPWQITPRRCHTHKMVKELKEIMIEALREYNTGYNASPYRLDELQE